MNWSYYNNVPAADVTTVEDGVNGAWNCGAELFASDKDAVGSVAVGDDCYMTSGM